MNMMSVLFKLVTLFLIVSSVKSGDICDLCICNIQDELPPPQPMEINCRAGELKRTRSFSLINVEWPNESQNIAAKFNNLDITRIQRLSESSSIISLNFDDNLIGALAVDPFKPFRKLRKLSIANNKITELRYDFLKQAHEIEYLNLSGNSVDEINPQVFLNTRKLKVIDLSRNQLKTISAELITIWTDVLILNLAENQIETIDAIKPDSLSWEELNLSGNHLKSLDSSFKNLIKLQRINLSRNKITHLNEFIFADASYLESLDLSENSLEKMHLHLPVNLSSLNLAGNCLSGSFSDYSDRPISLLELYLQNNRIDTLEETYFENNQLRVLNLSNNLLTTLPDATFPDLEFLDLSNNVLTAVPQGMLERTPLLDTLVLDGNSIEIITFTEPIAISKLYLRNLTQLTTLGAESGFQNIVPRANNNTCFHLAIANCPNLTDINAHILHNVDLCSLDLSNNNINTLPQFLTNWTFISEGINLQGNPFDCSCEANWMVDNLLPTMYNNTKYQYLLEDFRCAEPETYVNHRFVRYYNNRNAFCGDKLFEMESMPYEILGAGFSNIPANRNSEKLRTREAIIIDDDSNQFKLNKGLGLVIVLCVSLFAIVTLLSVILYMILDLRKKRVRKNRKYEYGLVTSTNL